MSDEFSACVFQPIVLKTIAENTKSGYLREVSKIFARHIPTRKTSINYLLANPHKIMVYSCYLNLECWKRVMKFLIKTKNYKIIKFVISNSVIDLMKYNYLINYALRYQDHHILCTVDPRGYCINEWTRMRCEWFSEKMSTKLFNK